MLTLKEQLDFEKLRAEDQLEIKALRMEQQRTDKATVQMAALLLLRKMWESI